MAALQVQADADTKRAAEESEGLEMGRDKEKEEETSDSMV